MPAIPVSVPLNLPFMLKTAVYLVMSATIAFLLVIFFSIMPEVYSQASYGWIEPQIKAECLAEGQADPACPVTIMPLQDGRYRISAKSFPGHTLRLHFTFQQQASPRVLMVRRGFDILGGPSVSQLQVLQNGKEIENSQLLNEAPGYFTKRALSSLPDLSGHEVTVEISDRDSAAIKSAQLVIDEIGFLANQPEQFKTGLDRWLSNNFYNTYHTLSLLFIAVFGLSVLCGKVFKKSYSRFQLLNTLFIASAALAYLVIRLYLHFSVDTFYDLRVMYASGTLQEGSGSNLNYGIYMVSNFLKGNGPILAQGIPAWNRMPGYGVLGALVMLFISQPDNLLLISMNIIMFQLIAIAIAAAFFFWSASKIMPPFVAGLITLYILWLPNQIYYTQIESLMPAIILLNLGFSCLYINAQNKSPLQLPPLVYHLVLHLGFALWFFLRPDVVPAWFIMSAFLYGRRTANWKYLLLPIAFYLLVGLPWAYFKSQFTHEFSLATNSVGASLMVGLWEIPHKFIWTVSDGTYYQWMHDNAFDPVTKVGNDSAVREVFRFYLTYPIYMIALVWHKFIQYSVDFSEALGFSFKLTLLFLSVISASFLMRFKPLQTLLLSWPFLFNLTVFFFTYSSGGRFYMPPTISLFVAAAPLLANYQFYLKLYDHKRITLGIICVAFMIFFYGVKLDNLMVGADNFRYFAPFLDPSTSLLNVVKPTTP